MLIFFHGLVEQMVCTGIMGDNEIATAIKVLFMMFCVLQQAELLNLTSQQVSILFCCEIAC
jgi:hypothetical protein